MCILMEFCKTREELDPDIIRFSGGTSESRDPVNFLSIENRVITSTSLSGTRYDAVLKA